MLQLLLIPCFILGFLEHSRSIEWKANKHQREWDVLRVLAWNSKVSFFVCEIIISKVLQNTEVLLFQILQSNVFSQSELIFMFFTTDDYS